MRQRADVVEEVRDQAKPDLGTLQRQIMSLRLYVINTYLEVKDDRPFSLSRTREPVWLAELLTLSCFQWHSQIIKVSSGISTWPCRQKTEEAGQRKWYNKDTKGRKLCKSWICKYSKSSLFSIYELWKGRKLAPRQMKITPLHPYSSVSIYPLASHWYT